MGHVIIGATAHDLHRLRAHELVHVRQFEQWGPLFLLAYPLASLVALIRGHGPYTGNWFEMQAFKAEQAASRAGQAIVHAPAQGGGAPLGSNPR